MQGNTNAKYNHLKTACGTIISIFQFYILYCPGGNFFGVCVSAAP